MRVHHLNCITMCPIGGGLMDGRSGARLRGRLSCHCLLVEAGESLVLVDTGFGLKDVADPRSRLSAFFLAEVRPEFREDMTAIRQIESLGFDPREVRDIVLTHLDFDHAGGLDDFPWARVHMLAAERACARTRASARDRGRYRPQQWSGQALWRGYDADAGSPWYGFDCVRDLDGLPPEILLVPLIGHTLGHAGVALRTDVGWMLHAGDAYFHHGEMDVAKPWGPAGVRSYEWMMEMDRASRLANQQRLRDLLRDHGSEVRVFCAHDLHEFERLSEAAAAVSHATQG